MSYCPKCIAALDARDPLGARHRAMVRALSAKMPPAWQVPDLDFPNQVCIDCPACGGHSVVDEGEQWCMNCRWELGQVERHVGPPVETGFRVGDVVLTEMLTMGRVNYIDPSGFVDMLSSGWTMRYEPEELRKVKPRTSYAGDIALGLDPLEPGQYPPVRMLWELSEEGAA